MWVGGSEGGGVGVCGLFTSMVSRTEAGVTRLEQEVETSSRSSAERGGRVKRGHGRTKRANKVEKKHTRVGKVTGKQRR